MMVIIYGLLAAILFAVFLGVAHHFGAGPMLHALQNRLGQWADRVSTEAQIIYFGTIVPGLKRLGWGVVLILCLGCSASLALSIWGDAKWWVPLGAFIFVLLASIWIGWNNLRSHGDFSSNYLFMGTSIGLFALGVWLFGAAHASHDRALAVLGASYILMARDIVFLVVEIVVRMLAFGVYAAEGSTNFFVRSVIAFIPESVRKDLQNVIPPSGVVYAVEERWVPVVRGIKRQVNNLLYPTLALGIIFANPVLTGFAVMAGLARHMYWGYLEGNGVDTQTRRERSARSFEKICQILIFITGVIVFVPGASAQLDKMYYALGAVITRAFSNTNDELERGIGWLSGVVAFGGLLILCLRYWPRHNKINPQNGAVTEHARAPFMKWVISTALMLSTLFCLGMFGWGIVKAPIAKATEATMQRMIKDGSLARLLAPRLTRTSSNAVRITLPAFSMPDAKRYEGCVMTVERRAPSDVKYTKRVDLPPGFDSWDDTTVTVGNEYVYHVIADCNKNPEIVAANAEIAKGTDATAEKIEARVVGSEARIMVEEPAKLVPAKPAAFTAPATRVAGCANGSCTRSPELSELCNRYPESCK